MSEMSERVALAIQRDSALEPGGKPLLSLETARMITLTALAEMRELTPEIGMAIYAAWDKFGEDPVMGPEEAGGIWRAAIDATLK